MIALFLDENLASNNVARQPKLAGHTVFLPQELGYVARASRSEVI
jgi:hypothetical protein